MEINPIGIIHSPFAAKETCPIQPLYASGAVGRVEVFDEFAAGLKDIEGFSHIYLLYQLDRAGKVELVRAPFLDDTPHGIYATRHPCRPNGIGMSIVKLIKRENNILTIEGIDVLDQTPLIDIKPYVPKFDCFEAASEGWFAGKQWSSKPAGKE
ncbi:MAG: tRNA (N6-threonylcarbamoyladenosine(37)-N6)-methyltransferase TrmO [Gammaproteobacteria bacterium]|nr:tRNA (N6-threonylcarbamoyladenosine(37)-N6)-methyltransferase TrmO [Gammaproteobacteria bacterium]MBU1482958.1 tRNA (N6-threonylcarbamoyladenosine(37)-N6)-methyltransferase TrmO [Gammaproteobacteria bacterium]